MEQGGASSLPPLLPSVPIPVPVSDPEPIVEQVVEQELCNLTELVPVRSKQLIIATDQLLPVDEELVDDPLEGSLEEVTAMQENQHADIIDTKIIAVPPLDGFQGYGDPAEMNSAGVSSGTLLQSAPETQSESVPEVQTKVVPRPQLSAPPAHVPPHLFGRTVDNPLQDVTGRRVQKPRLGVKVPYRNLTSQIVTQKEIAQEIYERTAKNNPGLVDAAHQQATAGSIANTEIFTRKLTQRLASSITSPGAKTKVSIVPESIGTLKALLPTKQSASVVESLRLSPGFTYNEKEKAMDDAELLSILEGDGDPLWLPDKLLRKAENTLPGSPPNVSISIPSPQFPSASQPSPVLPKLDPVVEKELALKQLMELPIAFPPKKPEKKRKREATKKKSC